MLNCENTWWAPVWCMWICCAELLPLTKPGPLFVGSNPYLSHFFSLVCQHHTNWHMVLHLHIYSLTFIQPKQFSLWHWKFIHSLNFKLSCDQLLLSPQIALSVFVTNVCSNNGNMLLSSSVINNSYFCTKVCVLVCACVKSTFALFVRSIVVNCLTLLQSPVNSINSEKINDDSSSSGHLHWDVPKCQYCEDVIMWTVW